ncbi:MAG: hypothetical protein NDJ94_11270 [Vicinamibacteria bacterium]|nr:hypothetical protein [Vicinamibacteria bacterium]
MASAAPAPPRAAGAGQWRRCAAHPKAASDWFCVRCNAGYCGACPQRVSQAAICPGCDGPLTPAADRLAHEAKARDRARSMRDEVAFILRYPLVDVAGYAMLAVFVGICRVVAAMGGGGGMGALLTQGVLMAYSFSALTKTAGGDRKAFMPQIDNPLDLALPLRLGFAAVVISAGPLLATLLFTPAETLVASSSYEAVAHAQEPAPAAADETGDEGEELAADEAEQGPDAAAAPEPGFEAYEPEPTGVPAWAWLLFAVSFVWFLAYSPIALIAAGLSRSVLQTLNPLVGLHAIQTMGATYWHAAALYTGLTLVQVVVGSLLEWIPLAGVFLRTFPDCYLSLCIGATLGLAVFKKGPELGYD